MLKASTDNSTTRIAGGAGAVVAAGAATVNSNSAGSVNTTSVRAQLSRTAGGAFSDRVLIPNPSRFAFNTGSHTIVATVRGAQIAGGAGAVIAAGSATVNSNGARSVIIINSDAAQIATGTGAVNAAGAAAVSSQSAGAVNRYKYRQRHPGALIAAGAAAVDSQSAGAVNRYNGHVVSQPTRRMICFVLGVAVGLSKIDTISFVLGVA